MAKQQSSPNRADDESPHPGKTWMWTEHLGLLISMGLGVLTATQLLAAAGWNTATALVILHARGTTDMIVGTFLVYAPLVITAAVAIALGTIPFLWIRRRRRPELWIVWLAVTGAALLILIAPVFLSGFAVTLSVVAGLGLGAIERRLPGVTRVAVLGLTAVFVLPPLIASAAIWVPAETVKIADEAPVTAYVLEDDGETWTVLLHRPRQARLLPSSAVESRQVCDSPRRWWQSRPFELLDARAFADYPVCRL